jgi:hypothetical protein
MEVLMEIWKPIFLMLNLVGWLGVVEVLLTCWEDYKDSGRLDRQLRVLAYCAVALVYILTQIKAALFDHL